MKWTTSIDSHEPKTRRSDEVSKHSRIFIAKFDTNPTGQKKDCRWWRYTYTLFSPFEKVKRNFGTSKRGITSWSWGRSKGQSSKGVGWGGVGKILFLICFFTLRKVTKKVRPESLHFVWCKIQPVFLCQIRLIPFDYYLTLDYSSFLLSILSFVYSRNSSDGHVLVVIPQSHSIF